MLDTPKVETLRQRLNEQALSVDVIGREAHAGHFVGAAGVFLLVFLSTFPVVIPLIVRPVNRGWPWALSNTVAVLMLFVLGLVARAVMGEGLAGGADSAWWWSGWSSLPSPLALGG